MAVLKCKGDVWAPMVIGVICCLAIARGDVRGIGERDMSRLRTGGIDAGACIGVGECVGIVDECVAVAANASSWGLPNSARRASIRRMRSSWPSQSIGECVSQDDVA